MAVWKGIFSFFRDRWCIVLTNGDGIYTWLNLKKIYRVLNISVQNTYKKKDIVCLSSKAVYRLVFR